MNKRIITFAMSALLALSTACSGEEAAPEQSAPAEAAAQTSPETTVTEKEEVTSMTYTIDTTKPLAALTFDDGPNTNTTVQVLDILEKYQVPASFFLIGNNITPASEEVVKRAYDMGCEIDNHSKTHSDMTKMTPEEIQEEVSFVYDKVMEITGKGTKFFRPPYIAVNSTMYDSIDMPFICGAGCNDWDKKVTVQQRYDKTMEQLSDGVIILLHDAAGNSQTVEALEKLIPAMLEEGYQFVTVSELFEAKGIEISPDDTGLYTIVNQQ